MVRSFDPVANHSLEASTAIALTQPRCPEITLMSFHGACHSGVGSSFGARRLISMLGLAARATSAPPPSADEGGGADTTAAAGVGPATASGPAAGSARPAVDGSAPRWGAGPAVAGSLAQISSEALYSERYMTSRRSALPASTSGRVA